MAIREYIAIRECREGVYMSHRERGSHAGMCTWRLESTLRLESVERVYI